MAVMIWDTIYTRCDVLYIYHYLVLNLEAYE